MMGRCFAVVLVGTALTACPDDTTTPPVDHDVAADVLADVTGDTQPDIAADVQPDIAADAQPDVAADAQPDVAADAQPDVAADAKPDVANDTQADAVDDAPQDVAGDTAGDVGSDAQPDSVADTSADTVQSDGATGDVAASDAGVDASDDAGTTDTGTADVGTTDGGSTQATCADYCVLMEANCTGGDAQYATTQACLDLCAIASWDAGDLSDTSGNTIGCRMYHAELAGSGQVDAHCGHAGPSGGDSCGSWCDNYCHLADKACPGDDALFSNAVQCLSICSFYPAGGAPGDASGNSVQCRIDQLASGYAEPAVACPNAQVAGGDVCTGTAGSTGGDSCGAATVIDELPFEAVGDTTSSTNAHVDTDCGSKAGHDVAYSFTPTTTGGYSIFLSWDGQGPTIVSVVTNCADMATSCQGFTDLWNAPNGGPGGYGADYVYLEAGTEYFILLDGFFTSDNGEYALAVFGSCVPSCQTDAQCGDDSCGGFCGAGCSGTDVCDDQMCVAP